MFSSEQGPGVGAIRAYTRVSTEEQAQEGHSLQTQREEILRLVRYKWPEAAVTWYEDDGWSAKDTKRPGLQRLRSDVRPADVVVCLRLDRLTRSVFDLYTLLTEWDKRQIRFRSVREDYDTSTASGKFMIGLLALLAQWERERIAERVREVMTNVVTQDRRHLSKPPLGYDLIDKRLVMHDAEAALVRRIYGQYLAGKGTRALANALNAEGIRTKSGTEWTDFGISYILSNPIYTGKVTWGRLVAHGRRRHARSGTSDGDDVIVVEGLHEPIVDAATWQAVQELKAQRRKLSRAATGPHCLTGVARCGLCGGPVHGFVQRRYRQGKAVAGKERAYYRCSNRNHKDRCQLPYLAAEELEAKVLAEIGELGEKPVLDAVVAELVNETGPGSRQSQIDELNAELKKLERKCQRWDSLFEEGAISKDEWRTKTMDLREKHKEKRLALADLVRNTPAPLNAAEVAQVLTDLPLVWRALSPDERKVVLQALVVAVIVHAGGYVTVRLREYSHRYGGGKTAPD